MRMTFAEIVDVVENAPVVERSSDPIVPGGYGGATLHDLSGNTLVEVDGVSLDLDEVRAAVLEGALVVWDSCGCGGYCNDLEWPDPASLRRAATLAAPRYRKNNRARVTRMTGAGGHVLLVAGDLRWGDLFR